MTGPELEAARCRLGLTAAQLGRLLRLTGRDPGRDVRRWETGKIPVIPGPVQVAVELLLQLGAPIAIPKKPPAPKKPADAPLTIANAIVASVPPNPFTRRRSRR